MPAHVVVYDVLGIYGLELSTRKVHRVKLRNAGILDERLRLAGKRAVHDELRRRLPAVASQGRHEAVPGLFLVRCKQGPSLLRRIV